MKELQYPFDADYILQNKKKLKRLLLDNQQGMIKKKIAILGGSTTSNIKQILELFLLDNKIELIYYYLFVIMGLYLTMPLLSQLTNKKYRKTLWYIIFIFFIFNSFIPEILSLFNLNWNNSFSVFIGCYAMYAILGYLLSTEDIQKKHRIIIYILAILSIIYRYVSIYILSYKTNQNVILTWNGHWQTSAILQSTAVFLFVKNLNLKKLEKNEKITKLIAKIASCSFGIYLLHLIVKYYEVALFNINIRSWEWRTFGVITTYLISLAIVLIIKKIPILKRIVG